MISRHDHKLFRLHLEGGAKKLKKLLCITKLLSSRMVCHVARDQDSCQLFDLHLILQVEQELRMPQQSLRRVCKVQVRKMKKVLGTHRVPRLTVCVRRAKCGGAILPDVVLTCRRFCCPNTLRNCGMGGNEQAHDVVDVNALEEQVGSAEPVHATNEAHMDRWEIIQDKSAKVRFGP